MTHLDFQLQFVDIPPTVPLFDLVAEPVLLAGKDSLAAPQGKDVLTYRISNGADDPDPGILDNFITIPTSHIEMNVIVLLWLPCL